MTTNVQTDAIARGVVLERGDGLLVLAVAGTEYRMHLVATTPADGMVTPVGKRIKGIIEAEALRMHTAQAGGRFVEPMWGAPRIVQGTVLAVDEQAGRVLLDVSVPMWVTVGDRQSASDFQPGQMVNFYVRSGASFTPIET